jgi:hypothetical protein
VVRVGRQRCVKLRHGTPVVVLLHVKAAEANVCFCQVRIEAQRRVEVSPGFLRPARQLVLMGALREQDRVVRRQGERLGVATDGVFAEAAGGEQVTLADEVGATAVALRHFLRGGFRGCQGRGLGADSEPGADRGDNEHGRRASHGEGVGRQAGGQGGVERVGEARVEEAVGGVFGESAGEDGINGRGEPWLRREADLK